MAGMGGPEVTEYARRSVSIFVRAVYGDRAAEMMQVAADLAGADVHRPLSGELARFGRVETLTSEDSADTACVYRVRDDAGNALEVYAATVLPYATILARRDNQFLGYAYPGAKGWAADVSLAVQAYGLILLSGEECRSISPVRNLTMGTDFTMFEVLFATESDTP